MLRGRRVTEKTGPLSLGSTEELDLIASVLQAIVGEVSGKE